MMSDSTANRSPSLTSPIAIPATGVRMGTPASIRAMLDPHTEAIELEPFDSVISDTTRMTYGKSSREGITERIPRFASRPWPISRRLGPMFRPVSPTQ